MPKETAPFSIDHYVQAYGDFIFDFCVRALLDKDRAQSVVRTIFKRIRASAKKVHTVRYERAWIISVACQEIKKSSKKPPMKAESQNALLQLEAEASIQEKLSRFDLYLERLSLSERILLLLKDKYDIPYSEIAAALRISEEAIKIERSQVLHTLEAWIWPVHGVHP